MKVPNLLNFNKIINSYFGSRKKIKDPKRMKWLENKLEEIQNKNK